MFCECPNHVLHSSISIVLELDHSEQYSLSGNHCLKCFFYHVETRSSISEKALQKFKQYLQDHPEEALEL